MDSLQAGSGASEVAPGGDSGKTAVDEAVPPAPKPAISGRSDQKLSRGVASSGGQAISFTGLLDTYFTYNTNSPPDGHNTLYYTNPNARGFGLNQAKIEIDASGDGPIGFRSDIWFGSGARLFRDGLEPGPLEDVLYLQQAYGYYQFSNGAQLDVGLFGTIAGLEVAESHLNWNYTRGILWAWNEPFSHLGARLSMPMTDTFTSTVMLVNGFDNAWDQNTGKSYGLQGSFAPNDGFNTTLTWINGPENWGTNEGWLKNLLRNYRLNDVARLSVDESETEVSGALGQAAHGTGAILSVVGGGPGVLIDEPILESAVDENGELSSGGGDGFGFTDAIGETSIVGAESGLCTPEAECGHAENASGAVCRGLCFRAEESPAGDFVIGREGKPGSEVLFSRPSVHIGTDLGEQAKRGIGSDGVDLGEVDPGDLVEERPELEPRFVHSGLARFSRRWQGGVRG